MSELFALTAALVRRWTEERCRLRRDREGAEPFVVGGETWSFEQEPESGQALALTELVCRLRCEILDVRFRNIFESASTILAIANQEGKFVLINGYATKILGWSVDELLKREFIHLVHPDDVERTLSNLGEHRNGEGTSGFENRYLCRSGDYVWLRWHSSVRDDGLIYASATEVTAEVEHRQRNAKLEELHNAAARLGNVGVYEVDLQTGLAWWSDEVKRIHEVPMDYEPQLDKAIEFYAPEARAEVQASIDDAIETGKTWDFELPFITAKGRRIWVRAFGRAVYSDGQPIGLRGGFQEVTARKAQEDALRVAMNEAKEASESKSSFMASMSHEIRNPVSGLMGVLRLLAQTELTDHQRRLVRLMQDSGATLTTLLDRVLNLNRLESDQGEVNYQPVDIANLCRRSLDAMSAMRPDLATSVDAPEALWVLSDAASLRQIVDNLVSNALRYTPKGSVRVAVRDLDGVQLISVADTGVGIDPSKVEAIFRRFYREPTSPSGGYVGGTGLGLSIAQQIAELMGGSLTVESSLGEGSTFTLRTSFASAQPSDPADKPHTDAVSLPPGLRVLVVEDEAVNRFVMCQFLEQWGVKFFEGRDGLEALEMVKRVDPDVVLMDCVMPSLDGWEATRRLRERGFKKPVIALTGSATEVDIRRAFEAGMNDHISKPCLPETLQACLSYWTKGRAVEVSE